MDYISKVYKNISKSKELQEIKNMLKEMENNISNKDFDNIDDILSSSIVGGFNNLVTKSLEDVVKELIDELYDENEIVIYSGCKIVKIQRAWDKINHYHYAKNSSSHPPSSLLDIDFKDRKIICYNSLKEYEKAQKFLIENINEKREDVTKQEKIVEELNSCKGARSYLLKKPSLWGIGRIIKMTLFPSSRQKFDNILKKQKERESRYLDGLKERLNETEQISFMSDYRDIIKLRVSLLEKLEPLQFKAIDEIIEYDD